jgi:flagellar hook-associated protein 2
MATTSSVNVTNSVLDVASIVDNLIAYESAPITNMQSQVTSLQSKVTAYQSLNTKLSAMSDKLNTLLFGSPTAPFVQPYSFAERLSDSVFSKCMVASSNEDTISATASSSTISGSYAITVTDLAQAQAMASSGFSSSTAASLGTGTLTITTGSNDPVTISIGSSNNTLTGLRDAINNSGAGITATIVNDGSATPYRLLIRADDTGVANSFTITNNLSGGQAMSLAQTQAASDALFSVNGLSITKSSNTVSDVIDGVSFTLKQETASPVTLSVDKDTDAIVAAFKEFVTAYNAVSSYVSGQFTYNASKDTAGVLAGDPTLRSIQSKLQSPITQSITNRFTAFGVAGRIGLEFNRDGSLTLNESELQEALADNFTGVAAIFLGDGTPSGGTTATDSRVSFDSKTAATQNGTYSIQVDTLAQQASLVGAQMLSALTADETLTITSGSTSAVVSLLQNDSLSAVLSKINSALSAQGMAVNATDDGTGKIKITTNEYGSSQNLTVVSSGYGTEGTSGFGLTPATSTGVDIAGTINGHNAVGSGLMLTGAAGQPEEGLSLRIAQTTIGNYGSVTVASDTQGSEGASVLMNLFSTLKGIKDPLSGPIQSATDGLNRNITALKDNITNYQERMEIRRGILTQAYNQADQALRMMSVSQAQLSSLISSLSS